MAQLNNYQVTVTSDFKLSTDERQVAVGSRKQILARAMSIGRDHKYTAVIVAASANDIQFNLPRSAEANIRQI